MKKKNISANCPKCGGKLSKFILLFKSSHCPVCGTRVQAKYPPLKATVLARIIVICAASLFAPFFQESATAFYLIISFVILLAIFLIAKYAMEIQVCEKHESMESDTSDLQE